MFFGPKHFSEQQSKISSNPKNCYNSSKGPWENILEFTEANETTLNPMCIFKYLKLWPKGLHFQVVWASPDG